MHGTASANFQTLIAAIADALGAIWPVTPKAGKAERPASCFES